MNKHHRNLLYLIIALLVALNIYQKQQNNLTEKVAIKLIDSLNEEEEKSLKLWKEKTVLEFEAENHQKKLVDKP